MYAPQDLPDLEVLVAALRYEPETGRLFIRKRTGERLVKPGPRTRYLTVKVGGRKCYAHRVAWKMFYGADPEGILDHADRDKHNNRIDNLRVATIAENLASSVRKIRKKRQLPRGVTFNPENGTYRASVYLGAGRRVTASFSSLKDAISAYRMAATARFGDFVCFDEVQ